MSDKGLAIARSRMSPQERRFRSELAQLVSQRGLIRGSLLVRRRVCGKPNCHCASGEGHQSLYLVISEGGRSRQLFVPNSHEQMVRRWVADYRTARRLLEEISALYWDKVRQRREG
jgi:hypothetical protein